MRDISQVGLIQSHEPFESSELCPSQSRSQRLEVREGFAESYHSPQMRAQSGCSLDFGLVRP